jgi:hypothetical protein
MFFGLNDVAFLAAVSGPAIPNDPNFANVVLLLHGDGANGSTTIIDSSPSPKTVTAVGDAQISTAQSKFGGASILFDGSGDCLTIPYSEDFNYGTSNFTIETYIYPTAFTNNPNIYSQRVFTGNGITFRITTLGRLQFFYGQGVGLVAGATNITLNTWNHVALTKNNNVVYLWLNGVQDATIANAVSLSNPDSSINIGRYPGLVNEFFFGYIDDLRITKGVARYTANFTPPTAPFPDA